MIEITYASLLCTFFIVAIAAWGCWRWGYQIGHIDGEFEGRKEIIEKYFHRLESEAK